MGARTKPVRGTSPNIGPDRRRRPPSTSADCIELELGLDSFVFVGDDALEHAEVKPRWPDVMTIQLPADSDRIPQALRHLWTFAPFATSGEDRRVPGDHDSLLREPHVATLGRELDAALRRAERAAP